MTTAGQLALTSTQVVAVILDGNLSAETYVTTLIARAETLKDLNALITIDKAGALAAARNIDALRKNGMALPALAGLRLLLSAHRT